MDATDNITRRPATRLYAVTVTGRKFDRSVLVIVEASNAKDAKRIGRSAGIDAATDEFRGELAVTTTVERVHMTGTTI